MLSVGVTMKKRRVDYENINLVILIESGMNRPGMNRPGMNRPKYEPSGYEPSGYEPSGYETSAHPFYIFTPP